MAKKDVRITISIESLVYDILNETYLRGRGIRDDENYKEVASQIATEDEESYAKISRSIKNAFAEIKADIAEYVDECDLASDNAMLDMEHDLSLDLTMPVNFNEAATSAIAEAVHDYIKNAAISDWYLATSKEDAADYETLAQASIVNVRNGLSKRKRPVRPPREPKIPDKTVQRLDKERKEEMLWDAHVRGDHRR